MDRALKISMTNTSGIIKIVKPCCNLLYFHTTESQNALQCIHRMCIVQTILPSEGSSQMCSIWLGRLGSHGQNMTAVNQMCCLHLWEKTGLQGFYGLVGRVSSWQMEWACKVKGWAYQCYQYSQIPTKTNVYVYNCKFWSFSSIQNALQSWWTAAKTVG